MVKPETKSSNFWEILLENLIYYKNIALICQM